MRRLCVLTLLGLIVFASGCESTRSQRRFEPFGKAYYLDGAGNLGFGQDTVKKALRASGFGGDVENIVWTSYTGPLGDQLIRINARAKADQLKKKIINYRKRYPNAPLYVIGLSAGTGVAAWAVEGLPDGMEVDTMVMLGSSLSSTYDMTECLKHVQDKVYFIYSPRDAVLSGFIPVTGTIDGQYFVEPAGLVGMRVPAKASETTRQLHRDKISNIPWQSRFERYGYAGGHTDGTSYRFVRYYIAPKLLNLGQQKELADQSD